LVIIIRMPDLTSIIQQLERQRTAIDNAIEALRGVSGESQPAPKRGRPKGKKRSMSEGRQRQAEAMRAYWAAKKAGGKKATKKAAKKRGLTAAGRKALSDAMKKRWAAKRSR
jgi:hypothetical protein